MESRLEQRNIMLSKMLDDSYVRIADLEKKIDRLKLFQAPEVHEKVVYKDNIRFHDYKDIIIEKLKRKPIVRWERLALDCFTKDNLFDTELMKDLFIGMIYNLEVNDGE